MESVCRCWCVLTPPHSACMFRCAFVPRCRCLSVSSSVYLSVNPVQGAGLAHHRWGHCVGCCHLSSIIALLLLPVACFMSFINRCPRANNSSLQPFMTVTSLSEPVKVKSASLSFTCHTQPADICVMGSEEECVYEKEEEGKRVKETEWRKGEGREIIKRQESCHVNRCSLFSVLD